MTSSLPAAANVDSYLRHVNEVNGRDNVFIGLCVCQCVRSEPVNQTVGALNVYSVKTVKLRISNLTHVFPVSVRI